MLTEMSKKKLIPEAMMDIQNEIDKLMVDTGKEDADKIFEECNKTMEELKSRIEQLKSFYK